MHATIKGVTEDMEALRFNTAIAKMMSWYNVLSEQETISLEEAKVYLQLLAPFAPHLTEELWERLGQPFSIHTSAWPIFDADKLEDKKVVLTVQINGKVRDVITLEQKKLLSQQEAENLAKASQKIKRYLDSQIVKKVIYIPGKVINFVI